MTDPPIGAPGLADQLLYLSGLRHAYDNDRLWLYQFLTTTAPVRLGILTALPNALIVMAFGLFSLVTLRDKTTAYMFLGGAPLVLVLGAFVPAFTRARVKRLFKKNSLPP